MRNIESIAKKSARFLKIRFLFIGFSPEAGWEVLPIRVLFILFESRLPVKQPVPGMPEPPKPGWRASLLGRSNQAPTFQLAFIGYRGIFYNKLPGSSQGPAVEYAQGLQGSDVSGNGWRFWVASLLAACVGLIVKGGIDVVPSTIAWRWAGPGEQQSLRAIGHFECNTEITDKGVINLDSQV